MPSNNPADNKKPNQPGSASKRPEPPLNDPGTHRPYAGIDARPLRPWAFSVKCLFAFACLLLSLPLAFDCAWLMLYALAMLAQWLFGESYGILAGVLPGIIPQAPACPVPASALHWPPCVELSFPMSPPLVFFLLLCPLAWIALVGSTLLWLLARRVPPWIGAAAPAIALLCAAFLPEAADIEPLRLIPALALLAAANLLPAREG